MEKILRFVSTLKPQIFCKESLRKFLFHEMDILRENYQPTFWCYGAIGQTLMRSLVKTKPNIRYRKEFLNLSDGGHVALDWLDNHNSLRYKDNLQQPTVILMPGLIGSSAESYMLHLVKQVNHLGYRCVVFNNRGNGGAELKTARTYCASNTNDLQEVILHIKHLYPQAPLIAAGVSLGGIILANYCARMGKQAGLNGAFTVSMAWNLAESTKTLEQPLNHLLFNSYLCNGLKRTLHKNRHFFSDMDLDYLMQSTKIREFDDRFVAKQFGYPSWREYYADASMHLKLNRVQIPLLALNAADDPFAPEHTLPCAAIKESEYVAMVVTKHGGHIGFLEGLFPYSTGYVDRLFAQFVTTVFEEETALKAAINDVIIKDNNRDD